jgi:hypothetical protein
VNGDGLDPHLFAGPDDTAGDLASIRDQYLLKLSRIERHNLDFCKKRNVQRWTTVERIGCGRWT